MHVWPTDVPPFDVSSRVYDICLLYRQDPGVGSKNSGKREPLESGQQPAQVLQARSRLGGRAAFDGEDDVARAALAARCR